MSRRAREFSKTGLYHIIFRGMNRHNLFEEENDFFEMMEIMKKLKQEMQFEIYAFCLMTNHVHILLKESNIGDILVIMKRLLTKYTGWFNRKYLRSGSLIANRYKSQPMEADEYLLSLVRYIHQNPIRANVVTKIDQYKWSSYPEYMKDEGWSIFLKDVNDESKREIIEELRREVPEIDMATKILEKVSQDEKNRARYESRLRWVLDARTLSNELQRQTERAQQAEHQAKQAEIKMEAVLNTAITALHQSGIDYEQIAEKLNTTVEHVLAIINP